MLPILLAFELMVARNLPLSAPCKLQALLSSLEKAPLLCTLPFSPHHQQHHKTTKQRGSGCWLCERADPGSVCFCLVKFDNSLNLFILKTLKDNTNGSQERISHSQTCFPDIAPRKKYPPSKLFTFGIAYFMEH